MQSVPASPSSLSVYRWSIRVRICALIGSNLPRLLSISHIWSSLYPARWNNKSKSAFYFIFVLALKRNPSDLMTIQSRSLESTCSCPNKEAAVQQDSCSCRRCFHSFYFSVVVTCWFLFQPIMAAASSQNHSRPRVRLYCEETPFLFISPSNICFNTAASIFRVNN